MSDDLYQLSRLLKAVSLTRQQKKNVLIKTAWAQLQCVRAIQTSFKVNCLTRRKNCKQNAECQASYKSMINRNVGQMVNHV